MAPTIAQNGSVAWRSVADVIDGRTDPHLFLPTEVFESVVRNAFVLEGWREQFGRHPAPSGLPPVFWEQLESISADYIEDLREQHRLRRMTTGTATEERRQSLSRQLCANRADALARARARFGPALDIFMYRHVAPTKSLQTDTIETPGALKSREQGCR